MPNKRSTKTTVKTQERRKEVAKLYLRGVSQTEIAERLGVVQSTISKDVSALLEQWKATQERTIDDAVTRQLEELKQIISTAWQCLFQSESDDAKAKWLDVIMKAQDRESKLLGLDAPKRTDVTTAGEPIKLYASFNPADWDHD